MMFMNFHEVVEARRRYLRHPVLGPATETLCNLMVYADAWSDGWAYWPKPARSARLLMELIGDMRTYLDDPDRADATVKRYKLALRPVKAFRTRQRATFDIIELS